MGARPRIDLDGVALRADGGDGMVLAVFRHRTRRGLVLLMPESGEFLVGWDDIADARLDLESGAIRVDLRPEYCAAEHWLRGSTTLVGRWIDRFLRD